MIDVKDFAVLIPYVGGLDNEHVKCREALYANGVQHLHINDMPIIDHARAYLAQKALDDSDAKVLLWIDHDILFETADVFKLAELCLNEHPIIGAAYSSRSPGGMIVGGFKESLPEVTFFENGGIYPAECLGMGFTAIRREVFEKVGEQLPTLQLVTMRDYPVKPYFAHAWRDGKYFGEDISFFHRAKDVGFNCMLDTRIRLFHKGNYSYGIEDTVFKVGRPPSVTLDLRNKRTSL